MFELFHAQQLERIERLLLVLLNREKKMADTVQDTNAQIDNLAVQVGNASTELKTLADEVLALEGTSATPGTFQALSDRISALATGLASATSAAVAEVVPPSAPSAPSAPAAQ